jgi:hypothetical protein
LDPGNRRRGDRAISLGSRRETIPEGRKVSTNLHILMIWHKQGGRRVEAARLCIHQTLKIQASKGMVHAFLFAISQ